MRIINRKVSFLDADKHRATIHAEITERNGYPEFTASGDFIGHSGQCLDLIKPNNEWQKQLIKLWEKWHLNGMYNKEQKNAVKDGLPEGFDDNLDYILNNIESAEMVRMKKAELENSGKTADELLLEQMHEFDIDEDRLDACKAYLELYSDDSLENFEESYQGEYNSREDFAQQMAEDSGVIKDIIEWPYTCIDWKHASDELMMDYSEQDGFYFRDF